MASMKIQYSERILSEEDSLSPTTMVGHKSRQITGEDPTMAPAKSSYIHSVENRNNFAASTTLLNHEQKEQYKVNDLQKYLTWTSVFWDTWLMEILSLCLSISCFVAIAALLSTYNRQAQPEILFHVSLNTLVSILATAAKSFLVSAVASALSQLKWCWYVEDRSLQGFQEFDAASRGPWGSLMLLWRKKKSPVAMFGAMVIILAITIDPFTQNLIKYPIETVQNGNMEAVIRKASTFNAPATSSAFVDALNAGVWTQAKQFQEQPQCPSGNCRWPSFQSLGWCSSCVDAMPFVHLDGCLTPNVTGPCGNTTCSIGFGKGPVTAAAKIRCEESFHQNLTGNSGPFNVTRTSVTPYTQVVWPLSPRMPNASNGQTWLGVATPVLALGYAVLNPLENTNAHVVAVADAQTCIVSPCVRTYEVAVADGVVMSNVSHINYGHVKAYNLSSECYGGLDLCWQAEDDNVAFSSSKQIKLDYRRDRVSSSYPDQFTNLYYNETAVAFCPVNVLSNIMAGFFYGNIQGQGFSEKADQQGVRPREIYLDIDTGFYTNDFMSTVQVHGLNYTLNGVAASLTHLGLDISNETIMGNMTIAGVIVHVEWVWLILPVIVEFMAIILLGLTILVSHKMKIPIWKSSALAVLYHGLEESITRDSRDLRKQSTMSGFARDTKVRLTSSNQEIGLLLRRSEFIDSKT